MKRTNFVTKFISVVLFLFVLVYLGIYLFQSVQNPLRTAPAIIMQAQDSFFTQGVIIRAETVIEVPYPVVASIVREGERVSVGMDYLVAYDSPQDLEQGTRRNQVEQEIIHLEARLVSGSGMHQTAEVEAEVRRQIRDLGHATRQGDLSDLDAKTIQIRTLVLDGDREGLTRRLEALQAEYESLIGASTRVRPIAATQAGIFSARVDGHEHLGPADLSYLGVSELRYLMDDFRLSPPTAGPGKLVTGGTWYYATLVPESEAEQLQLRLDGAIPNRVTLTFAEINTVDIPMRVHVLSQPVDGYRVAVFSANTALVETLGVRRAEAMVVFNTFTGFRVPKEAIHFGEPDPESDRVPTYLFTLVVRTAERKFVEIIYEGMGYYLVRPDNQRTNPESALREGNTIIVRGGDLYGGQVIRR